MIDRITAAGLMASVALGASPAHVHAQAKDARTYPEKSIRFIVPVAAGGSVDLATRLVANRLTERFGKQVLVDNRPGAGQLIGTEIAAKSPPDGYTLIMVATPFTLNPSLYSKMPYDSLRDFIPVTQVSIAPNVLVVHPSLPAKTVKELVALAKAKPGQIAYASSGVAGSARLAGELFQIVAGISLLHIPYKGSGQSVSDLVAGHVQIGFGSVLAFLPNINAGKLRAISVTNARRVPALKHVPTMAEAGYPGVETNAWSGVLVPAGTPQPIVAKLNSEIVSIVQSRDIQERLATDGAEAVGSTQEEFAAFIRREIDKWAKVVKRAGLKAD